MRESVTPAFDETDRFEPPAVSRLLAEGRLLGFQLSCDSRIESLLRALVAAKPNGRFLEIGAGIGVGTAWMLDGMTKESHLLSIEVESGRHEVAARFLLPDSRLSLVHDDVRPIFPTLQPQTYDLILADTWVGKYDLVSNSIGLLRPGGIFFGDDLLPGPGWGPDIPAKVPELVDCLESEDSLAVSKLCWASGVIITPVTLF